MTSSRPPQILPSDEVDRQEHKQNAPSEGGARLLDAAAATAVVQLLSRHKVATEIPSSGCGSSFPSAGDLITNDAYLSSSPPSIRTTQVAFTSTTTSPSPPLHRSPSRISTARRGLPDTEGQPRLHHSPLRGGGGGGNSLRIETDVVPAPPIRTDTLNSNATLSPTSGTARAALALQSKTSTSSLKPVTRTPSLKSAFTTSLGSASASSSRISSPIITAMGDVTPLPSPLLSSDSPGPWRKLARPSSRDSSSAAMIPDSVLLTGSSESISAAMASHTRRRLYKGLPISSMDGAHDVQTDERPAQPHTRNRSLSEYCPDPLAIPKRMVTVSGSHVKIGTCPDEVQSPFEPHLRREPHLSEVRGLTPIEKPPTPPPSESSMSMNESYAPRSTSIEKKPLYEYFEAHGRHDQKLRRWRAIKALGQGTFSRVMLATSQISPTDGEQSSESQGSRNGDTPTPEPEAHLDRRTLVAIKVCEHGPKGGASEDRIEMSLKRELEIMQTISHPSLVHLKAWSIEPTRAILVLSHCPGGDLFDVASQHRELLTPSLLRRVFSEVVGAVRYLHERRIVHRDVKLENVLVNLTPAELADPATDWITYPYSVTTLTDLGLSRRIADDEKLETRCGSDDYAAPEVIMGQPYDGRATDAWSLGVLLYALLEGRLPFDPPPGASDAHRMRSRTSHRIARVDWRWIDYAGEEGDHEGDPPRFEARGLLGAMEITEGLLKRARNRWSVEKVTATQWVTDAIQVEGGIKFREEEEGAEVL